MKVRAKMEKTTKKTLNDITIIPQLQIRSTSPGIVAVLGIILDSGEIPAFRGRRRIERAKGSGNISPFGNSPLSCRLLLVAIFIPIVVPPGYVVLDGPTGWPLAVVSDRQKRNLPKLPALVRDADKSTLGACASGKTWRCGSVNDCSLVKAQTPVTSDAGLSLWRGMGYAKVEASRNDATKHSFVSRMGRKNSFVDTSLLIGRSIANKDVGGFSP